MSGIHFPSSLVDQITLVVVFFPMAPFHIFFEMAHVLNNSRGSVDIGVCGRNGMKQNSFAMVQPTFHSTFVDDATIAIKNSTSESFWFIVDKPTSVHDARRRNSGGKLQGLRLWCGVCGAAFVLVRVWVWVLVVVVVAAAASTAKLFAKALSFTMFERSTKDDSSSLFIVNRACPVQSIGLPNPTVPFSKRIGVVGQHPFFTLAICN